MNNHNFVGLSTKEASSELARVKGLVTIMINRTADHWTVPSDCKSDSVENTLGIGGHMKQRKKVTFQLDEHKSPSKLAPRGTLYPLKSCLMKSAEEIYHTNSAPDITTADSPHKRSQQPMEGIPHTNSAPNVMSTSTHAQKLSDSKSVEDFIIPHIYSSRLLPTPEPPRKCCGCLLVPGSPTAICMCPKCSMGGPYREDAVRKLSSQQSSLSCEASPQQEPYKRRGSFAAVCTSYAQYKRGSLEDTIARRRNMSFPLDNPDTDNAHESVESWRMSLQFPEYLEEEEPAVAKYRHGKRVPVSPRGQVLTFQSDTSTLPRKISGSKLGVHVVELWKGSRRGWLGMKLRGSSSIEGGAPGHITVKDVIRGGPADGKVQQGDEVIEVNGVSFADMSIEEAIRHVRRIPGGKVLIIVRRHAEIHALNGIHDMLARMEVRCFNCD